MHYLTHTAYPLFFLRAEERRALAHTGRHTGAANRRLAPATSRHLPNRRESCWEHKRTRTV